MTPRSSTLAFMSIALVMPATAANLTIDLPLVESFRAPALDPAWKVDTSKDNLISVKDGSLEIKAAEHTYAHIQRPLGVDHIRASCTIQASSGVSWATSLFLYWRAGDWCQMSVISRNGGSYYVCLTANGQRTEQDLSRCRFTDFQNVAIELGDDCIRFMSSTDGKTWANELFVPRPAELRGPPALLVLGKGFGTDANSPDLNGDYGERGPVGISRVREVRVEKTEPARMKITTAERRERELASQDPLGRQILESGQEPSYEAVAAILPPLLKPREAVGAKEGRYEVGVQYEGTIQLDTGSDGWEQNGPTAWFELGSPPVRFGATGCAKRLVDGHLPVVVCESRHDGLTVEQTVLGWSEGMKPDTELWAYVRLTVTNPGTAARTAPVAFKSRPEAISKLDPVPLQVPAGGKAEVFFRVSSPARDAGAARVEAAEFSSRQNEVAAYWDKVVNAGMRVTTPEPRVNNAWRAWLAYNFINVDKIGDVYQPHDGAGFYEAIFGYSEVLYAHALDLWGFHDEARRYLESMFAFLKPDGLFAINYGLPDHGGLLFALAEHYRLTADKEWLHSVAPRMLKMCDWTIARRRNITNQGADRQSVTYGLIKFRPYCDYNVETYNYYANAYCCVGLEHAAAVLADADLADDAIRIADAAAAYRKDILASMDRAIIERDGMRLLPMEPDTHRLLKDSHNECGDYYGLVASMFLESEFLPPDDPRATLVVNGLEKRKGLILGMCEFNDGVDHAYTYGYWLNCLQRGEANRVLLGLYGSLAYGMGRETYCGVEVTYLKSGEPTPTMPHLYSGTQQLRILRMMLLREEGDGVLIGPAIPKAWLTNGKRIEVRHAETKYGPVSFVIESAVDTGRIDVAIAPPTRRIPARIQLHLNHPTGKPITEATVNGQPAVNVRGSLITIRPEKEPLKIQVGY
ncbi:MAG: hypothetical protein KA354_16070 [Phycisphaerae bacterium]|nr:hypothetical protein [Phycisphaerae bacterium]